MNKPYNTKDINLNSIIFSKLIDNSSRRSILTKYNKNNKFTKFLIQTPEVKILDIYNNNNNITILIISLEDKNPKIINFIKFWGLLDNHIINNAKNNTSWFFTNDVKFKGSIRTDNEYNVPYMKFKMKTNILNNIKVSYDKQSQPKNFSDLEKNQTIKLVLDIYGLWINKIGFGIYMKPIVIDIRANNEITLNESSDDNDMIDTEINPVSEMSVLNLNTETNQADENICSEIDSYTHLIELEIEDLPIINNTISEKSECHSSSTEINENNKSSDEDSENMSLYDISESEDSSSINTNNIVNNNNH